MSLYVPLSHGDLCDRLVILDIKLKRIRDPLKLKSVHKEHTLLANIFHNSISSSQDLLTQLALLQRVNEQLWEIEDELRAREKAQVFDTGFVDAARLVYQLNDRRCALKSSINILCDSPIREVKSYEDTLS